MSYCKDGLFFSWHFFSLKCFKWVIFPSWNQIIITYIYSTVQSVDTKIKKKKSVGFQFSVKHARNRGFSFSQRTTLFKCFTKTHFPTYPCLSVSQSVSQPRLVCCLLISESYGSFDWFIQANTLPHNHQSITDPHPCVAVGNLIKYFSPSLWYLWWTREARGFHFFSTCFQNASGL